MRLLLFRRRVGIAEAMYLRRVLGVGACLAAFLAAAPAGAEPRTHDGFYLRLALGIGGLRMDRTVEVETELAPDRELVDDSTIEGGAGHFELTLGGTPARGLVIGGSVLTHSVSEVDIDREAGEDVPLDSPLHFSLWGVTLDYFPDANGGFHFGGTAGIAVAFAQLPDEYDFEGIGGAGLGLSLGIGYDWWVADEWSLGMLGRYTGAGIMGEDTEPVGLTGQDVTAQEDSTINAFSIAFTVLHH
jgi:hypothetical protein